MMEIMTWNENQNENPWGRLTLCGIAQALLRRKDENGISGSRSALNPAVRMNMLQFRDGELVGEMTKEGLVVSKELYDQARKFTER